MFTRPATREYLAVAGGVTGPPEGALLVIGEHTVVRLLHLDFRRAVYTIETCPFRSLLFRLGLERLAFLRR